MNIALIPARGGSKSIPLKNIKAICGKPLIYWTLKAACYCKHIDKVYVATDSPAIRAAVLGFANDLDSALFRKVSLADRSAASASDTASTESLMLEFAQKHAFENIALIQATSPLLCAADLDRGFATFFDDGTDSVLSVVRQKRFTWACDAHGYAHPQNYDVFRRPRRQEFDGYLLENGAFYITTKKNFMESNNRISGRIRAVEMDACTAFEIDEPDDWAIVEAIMKKNGLETAAGELEI